MSWKQKTVIRILLLVARMICDEQWVQDEIKHLSNHIGMTLQFEDLPKKSVGAQPV